MHGNWLRWRQYQSFLDPWRRLDHHALLHFISIDKKSGTHFLLSMVRIELHPSSKSDLGEHKSYLLVLILTRK